MNNYEGGEVSKHAPLGCAAVAVITLLFWAVVIYGAYEAGQRTGCRTEAEVIAALKALHQPSIEVVP